MHCCLRYPRCFWQSVAQRSSCQTEIKRGVRYASQMVAELSSWKVHQGCSFWPIIWCFTHQCLSTTRLHTWPSSILCLHRWPSGHLRKPAIPVCWWLYTVCTNKICKRKGKCLNRDLEKMRVWAANWKVTFEPTKCKALMLSRKRMPTIPDLYFGSTQLAVERELCILGVTFDSKLLWSRHISDISKKSWAKTWSTAEDC